MENVGEYIATLVVGLVGGYLAQFVQPKAKVGYWTPHIFFFDLKEQKVGLFSSSITVQNFGRLPAEDVQIIHKSNPDFMELSPSITYTVTNNPNGEHIVCIPNLGPKEWVVMQMLTYKSPAPVLANVRCRDGQAKQIPIAIQRVYPKWFNIAAVSLMITGAAFILYISVRLGIFFYGLLNHGQ